MLNNTRDNDEADSSKSENEENKRKYENIPWKDLTISGKISRILKNTTVEPMLICFIMPSILEGIGVQNLGLEKACRVNKNYSAEICDGLMQQTFTTKRPEEIEVQTLVAYMNSWRMIIQSAIPAILVVFIGAWSDCSRKRKPCMIAPIVGESCTCIGLILCTYYFTQWPLEVSGLIESIFPAVAGGWTTMFMAVYSYIADNTNIEDRTFRLGIIDVITSAATTLGKAISGVMLRNIGFYGVFSACLGLYVTALLYISVRIKDVTINQPENTKIKTTCQKVVNINHIRETFMVLFKKRNRRRRLRIMLLMLVYIMVTGPIRGADMLQYLYLRKNFKFNEIDFSIFSLYSISIQLLGVIFALHVLTKHFHINDCVLAILACISKICASFIYTFAPSVKWIYLAPVVEFIGTTTSTAMRSIATKVVDANEIGKINSLFGICEVIMGLTYGPLFAGFYVNSLDTLPGAFFLLGALLTAPSVFIFMYMYKLSKADGENIAVGSGKNEIMQNDHELVIFKTDNIKDRS